VFGHNHILERSPYNETIITLISSVCATYVLTNSWSQWNIWSYRL